MQQYNLKSIGAFIHVLYLTTPILGVGAYAMNAVTMYAVLLPYIQESAPWFTAPVFIIAVLVLCLILLGLFYKFVYRAYFNFQNSQQFPEDGPVMQAIRKAVREEIKNAGGIKHE